MSARKPSKVSELSKIAAEICCGDVTQFDTSHKALRGTDMVVHLAGIRGDRPISMNEYRAVNVTETANLLKSCHVEGVRRFIYCSTVGVMGWIKNPPADETCKLRPIGPYHITKARAEELVTEYMSQGLVPKRLYEERLPFVRSQCAPICRDTFSRLFHG